MNAPVMEDSVQSSSMAISAFGAPGKFTGSSFESVDFSLPSYDEAVGGKATPREGEAPKFTNPFGSFDSGSDEAESKPAADEAKVDKAAEREAAKARKAEEKAEAEAKKAEEKAAAEKAKADKEARRKEQMELQRAAVERQKEAKSDAKTEVKEVRDVGEWKSRHCVETNVLIGKLMRVGCCTFFLHARGQYPRFQSSRDAQV